jgi:DNA end-binding protein Ku
MEPVGYKRINKATGKEVAKEDIVKGIEYEDGQYVVLSAEEIAAAYPKTTQTVEIQAFVSISDIPFVYLERPYYISPINKGAKVYALLREVLHKTKKAGIAKVIIQTKQHLAVLMACGPALVLNLLRWKEEIRPWNELNLPAEGMESTGLSKKEMAMGEQLVEDMSTKWEPQEFTDSFKEQILQLVKEKVAAGKTEFVARPEEAEAEPAGAKIYDLTEILRRSLKKTGTPTKRAAEPASGRGRQASKPKAAAKRAAPAGSPGRSRKTAAKKPGKTASRSRKAA